jgi:uncharacterized protein
MSSARPSPSATAATAPSDRVRLRRKRERGSYERPVIDAILDEALICHLGITDHDGQPIVTPTLHARSGDLIYLHGSNASRTLKRLDEGARACLTVSLVDGIVLARSAMHHSVNYRSVMLFGQARRVTDSQQKLTALETVIEHVLPGRWPAVRHPTENELRATAVFSMTICEASAKIRTGPPADDQEDYALSNWAGVIPLSSHPGTPEADPRLAQHIPIPAHVCDYTHMA